MKENKHTPPRLATWFLSKICPGHLYEEIEGDLIERFEKDLKTGTSKVISAAVMRRAKTRFVLNAIRFFRPGILLRNRFSFELKQLYMLRNYLKIAYRHVMKSKMFSFINVLGLSVGIGAFLLIMQYVRFERSYEDFHTNAPNIYRITLEILKGSEHVMTDCEMYAPAGPFLKRELPEVLEFARAFEIGKPEVKVGDKKFYEEFVFMADQAILQMFTFNVLQGNTQTALTEPSQAVVTESMAAKYFGTLDVIGESIEISKHLYKITAVVADSPPNTHLKINFLLSHNTLPQLWNYKEDEYSGNNEYLYLLMTPGLELADFNEKLRKISLDLADKIGDDRILAESMKDIHLYSTNSFEPEPPGNAQTVYFLMLVAFFILIIAWINYVNLSTARATVRAREVGIRKVMGSLRAQLVMQFLSESMLITLLAAVLALALMFGSLPFFIRLTGQPLPMDIFRDWGFWKVFLALLMGGALVAGLYPAFVLSSFQPVLVLKGRFRSTTYGQWLRKGLVVFQFGATVIVMICMITVYKQVRYLQDYNLGINIEQTLVLREPSVESDSLYLLKTQALKDELLKNSSIQMVAQSSVVPGLSLQEMSTTGNVFRKGDEKVNKGYIYYLYAIDENFIPAFKVALAAGRNFEDGVGADNQVLINEEAVHLLGFQNSAETVGSKISLYNEERTVIGVVTNFYQQSPKDKHLPMVFLFSRFGDYFSLRIKTNHVQGTIAAVKEIWDEVLPDSPFDYFFLDEAFNRQYRAEEQFGSVMGVFGVLAVLVACLGLFGLSSFTVVQRTKEIGIRKVLGASVQQIVHLLSKQFIGLVLVAALLALPAGYWVMKEWLSNYAVRIGMSELMFVVPLLVILLISMMTVSFQTVKAAQSNPVDSLKYE